MKYEEQLRAYLERAKDDIPLHLNTPDTAIALLLFGGFLYIGERLDAIITLLDDHPAPAHTTTTANDDVPA